MKDQNLRRVKFLTCDVTDAMITKYQLQNVYFSFLAKTDALPKETKTVEEHVAVQNLVDSV